MVQRTSVDNGCGAVSFPLTPMQQGMLFHAVGSAVPGVDIEQVVCELRHAVSVPEFEQAWQLAVQRHESLRTAFLWQSGQEPRQVVRPAAEVLLPIRVLNLATIADVERVIEAYLASDRRAGFAQLEAPLARLAVFRSDEAARTWFVFTYHHLILDARGMGALFQEVLDLHDALAGGKTVTLTPVRPYRDYVAWLQTLDRRRAETFWREQLHGLSSPTALPLPAPADAVGAGDSTPGELAWRFSAAETASFRAAAQRLGVTFNTLLQGAWALVLSRYVGEDDVVFGAVRACRHVPVEGAGTMVGMMINTVPLRVKLSAAASVEHWLRQLREQWVAMRDFEHTPLMQVQQWAEIAPGRALFDTLFNFQEPSWIAALAAQGGRWAERTFSIRSQPGYPLALDIYGDEALLIRAFHDRRRFAGETVARLLRHYVNAITALADPRTDRLGRIELSDAAERATLLQAFNRTALEYDRGVCVHTAFARQVAAGADRLAVSDPKSRLTYGELDARAGRLAERLRAAGVGRDALVAVCMKRSTEMIVAWLAAVKAGGAFTPIDPDYPPERIAYQLRDSNACVLLTQPHLRGILPALPPGFATIEVGEGAAEFATGGDVPAFAAPGSDALAYVIYTSGSTGQPKGVQIEHRALMNLVAWHQRTYGITAADRATQVASPAFDASVWEIWPYLTAGASVHIPDEDTRIAPARLWQWMAGSGITISFLPTPLAEAALNEPWPEGMALRALLTGGDQLKRPAPAGFPCALVNHYGPTESTVVATATAVRPADGTMPPIGAPIGNTTAYVLDRQQRLAPLGVPGELYLGGESLARGYHARPDLTAERFVAVDLRQPGNPGAQRLYRTGDLVRWRTDGRLDFLGRLDNQVKIRGCRIELGEVEAALQRHSRVREALVLARPDERGVMQLIGYVVASGAAPTADEVLAFVRETLPSYMVPAALVVLPGWPLTANGKVDRRALPPPPAAKEAAYAAPETPREQMVARVWAEVLGRPTIGRDDNFFDLGGHSLLAAQAMTRLNAALGAAISVRVLFDHPTLAAFAVALDQPSAALPKVPALRAKRRASPDLELVQPR